MSAFVSFTQSDRVVLFTDGAAYDDDGVLRAVVDKVYRATVPLAITALGNHEIGRRIAGFIVKEANRLGVDGLIDSGLNLLLSGLIEIGGWEEQPTLFHIAAWSPLRGAFHVGFQTVDEDDIKAFQLRELADSVIRGPEFPIELAAMFEPSPGGDAVAEFGSFCMGAMRNTMSVPLGRPDAEPRYLVGGHVDMTVVDGSGVRTERVIDWQDRCGEFIEPMRSAA
ncbi:MAG TPA: hypothetical protein VGC14_26730 [Rhizobium sp.]